MSILFRRELRTPLWLACLLTFGFSQDVCAQKIEAEAWTTQNGLLTEATTDVGGGLNVGWIDPNDWAEYSNQPLAAGKWYIEARIATMDVNRSIQLHVDDVLRTTVTHAGNTAGWQNWITATSGEFTLATGGNHKVRITFPVNNMNVNWIRFVPVASDAAPPSVPTGLGSPSQTESGIQLNWTASTDNVAVANYEIHVDGALSATVGAVTTAQVTGLNAATSYQLRVLAVDAASNKSALSTALQVSTLPGSIRNPVKIEAEAWTLQNGLLTEATSDVGGGLNVGWIDANDWAEYSNQTLGAGKWYLEARMATMATNRSVQLFIDDVLQTTLAYAGNTGGWQAWTTANSGEFTLATGGSHKVRIVFPLNNMNLNWIRLVPVSGSDNAAPSVPTNFASPLQSSNSADLAWTASTDNVGVTGYEIFVDGALKAAVGAVVSTQITGLNPGTAYAVAILAVDAAGNRSALSGAIQVTTPALPIGLKIEAEAWSTQNGLLTEATSDLGGGLNVGWIDANDWAEYLNQPLAAGTWRMEARMATMAVDRSIQLHVDGVLRTTLVHAGNTGGWQAWATVTSGAFTVPTGGNHTVRIVFPANNMNLNWIRLVPATPDEGDLNGVFVLKNRGSAKCVEVAGGSLINGGNVQQNNCNGSGAQKWELTSIATDVFRVRNVKSGLLMDVQGAGATDNVQQWGTTDDGPAQRWRILKNADGFYALNPMHDLTECLDIAGGSGANGANVQTYACNASAAQQFDFIPTTAANRCWAGDAPGTALATQEYWPNVPFNLPLEIVQEPAASGNAFFVMDQFGTVRRVLNDAADGENRIFFSMVGRLTISGESGLASMAFDPEYGISNRFLYITYISNVNQELRLSRLTASTDGSSVDLNTEVVLFRFQQTSNIHNSGALVFGPGPAAGATYLYMSVGDNGNNANGDLNPVKVTQMNHPHGKILRLSQGEYRSAAQLPWNFNAGAVNSYIVANGLRNPWRMSFEGDDLWIGNVGSNWIEEVNRFNVKTEVGANFGWPWCEGDMCCEGGINCNLTGLPPMPGNLVAPVHMYPRSDGPSGESSVIGGFIYHGSALPALNGKYIFADFSDQVIYSLDPVTKVRTQLLANTGVISDIGTDQNGEIFLVDYGRGNIYRVVSGQEGPDSWPPQNLADWGCFESLNNGDPVPAAGVHPINVAQRFWSDGADKERFVSIPDATTINVTDPDNWVLPTGGVTVKNFFWNGSIFETRLFVKHTDDSYAGYTYKWGSPTSATLVPAGGDTTDLGGGMVWNYPSRAQCLTCHTQAVEGSIALESRQMNVGNQLADLAHAGLLNSPNPTALAPFPDIQDWTVDIGERAVSYLHVNCANCHRGPAESEAGRATWDARYNTPLAGKGACDENPVEPVSGSPEERIIKPGNHTLSTIWLRAHQRDNQYMPPLGSQVPDVEGVNMLRDWMNQMTGCP